MSLLAPWPAVWAAAVAVPLLVLLYMLRLRRREIRVSSTLLWDQAAKDLHANQPFRRFRSSWSFILQLLALVAMLLAIARPVVPGTSLAAERIVIVLDRSASMSATDGSGSDRASGDSLVPIRRWDDALRSVRELLNDLERASGTGGSRPEAMLVSAAATTEPLTDFTSNTRDLRAALDGIEPTDQPLDENLLVEFLRTLRPAEGDASDDETTARWSVGVVLISDGGLHDSRLSEPPGGVSLSLRSVAPLVTASSGVSTTDELRLTDNVGIVSIAARRMNQDPSVVRVFARLVNGSATPISVPVLCEVDGSLRDSAPIELSGAVVEARSLAGSGGVNDDWGATSQVMPGQATVSFEVLLPLGASVQSLITLTVARPDVLDADNTASVVVPALRRPRVLVIAPAGQILPQGDRSASGASPDPFLLSAIEAVQTQSIRVIEPSTLAGWLASGNDASVLSAFDLLVFDRTAPNLTGSQTPNSSGVPTLVFGQTRIAPAPQNEPSRLRFEVWDRSHPIMRDVNLDRIVVLADAAALTLPIAAPTPTPSESIAPSPGRSSPLTPPVRPSISLARASAPGSGATLELIEAIDASRGTSTQAKCVRVHFDLAESNWGPSESFPIFLANAVDWLTGGERASGVSGRFASTSQSVTIGESAASSIFMPVPTPASATSLDPRLSASGLADLVAKMEGPSGTRSARIDDSGTATLPTPTRVGLHTLSMLNASNGAASDSTTGNRTLLPVNLLSLPESTAEVRTSLPTAHSSQLRPASAATDRVESGNRSTLARSGREVWHVLAMVALALLTAEWLAYAWQSRA